MEDYNLALPYASPALRTPDFHYLFISIMFFGLLCLYGWGRGKRLCPGHLSFPEGNPFYLDSLLADLCLVLLVFDRVFPSH